MIGWLPVTFSGGVAQHEGVRLELSEHSVLVDSEFDSLLLEDHDISGVGKGSAVWYHPTMLTLVLASRIGASAHVFRFRTSEQEKEFLYRDEDASLRRLEFHVAPDASLIGLYERGIFRILDDGAIVWHRLHDDISARILEMTRDHIVIETQWPPEHAGVLNRYRLADCRELFDQPPPHNRPIA